jgi:hypothetical protein
MLRSSLHLALVAALSTGLTLPARSAAASPAAGDADALYEEGRKDYNGGFYKSAIEKFEAAYKRSKNPLILYNIGLTYKKLYDDEPKPDFLKLARTALRDYVAAVEKDPGLGADPEEVKPVLADIDAELARVEPAVPAEGPPPPDEPPRQPRGEDPGKKLKLAGIGLMAGGGGLAVVGVILGGVFAAKGQRLTDELEGLYDNQKELGCPAMPGMGDSQECVDLAADVERTRDDGKSSNTASLVSFAVVGGVGALLAIGGAVSYGLGKRRTSEWQSTAASLRLRPTFGGLVLSGRF